jgi:hypothetical protein
MSSAAQAVLPTCSNSLPELRWSYSRGIERQHCRLALDVRHRAYEFLVWNQNDQAIALERFPFACDAIQRQSEYEAFLVAEGFSLEAFARAGLTPRTP